MTKFEELESIIRKLRAPDGCPWDSVQTHESLKPCCIEEAAEVIGGINTLAATGDAENLKEELGDLLMQVVLHSIIAEEEGYFTLDDVVDGISKKMIRRHPKVFGEMTVSDTGEVLESWEDIKKQEKQGKDYSKEFLPLAFEESVVLINRAKERKGIK